MASGTHEPPDELVDASPVGSTGDLSISERVVGGVVGAILAIVGSIAVFRSSNQAGTAMLLIGALGFLILAVQGTSLIKFGSGQNSVELARRRQRVLRAIEVARAEENPDIGAGIVEGALLVESYSSPALRAALYEREVASAFARVAGNFAVASVFDEGVDLVTAVEGRQLGALLKYRDGAWTLSKSQIDHLISDRSGSGVGPLLVVTNGRISAGLAGSATELLARSRPVVVVRWASQSDDEALRAAVARLTR